MHAASLLQVAWCFCMTELDPTDPLAIAMEAVAQRKKRGAAKEKTPLTLEFAPTKLGIMFEGNLISEVKPDGQAGARGVKVGWITKAVNGATMPCDSSTIKSIIAKSIKAGQSFDITFVLDPTPLPIFVHVRMHSCTTSRHACICACTHAYRRVHKHACMQAFAFCPPPLGRIRA